MPRVWVFDVGQGDSIIVEQDGHYIVIDGDSTSQPDCGKQVIEPFLMSRALGIVDVIFLTHADLDHMNDLGYLANRGSRIRVKRVTLNSATEIDSHYVKLMASLRENPETKLFFMDAGDVYGNFHCLQSPREVLSEEASEQFSTLLSTANGKHCLSTGDAGQPSREKLLEWLAAPERVAECAALADIDPLKVGHHGPRGASSEAFLALLSSDCALISRGQGNSYGYPHTEATERLRHHTGQAYSTAKEGASSVGLLSD